MAEKSLNGQEIRIQSEKIIIEGNLQVPEKTKKLVLFAHGSGSGRFSPRNQYVAKVLFDANIATLLIDLLTREEEAIDEWKRLLEIYPANKKIYSKIENAKKNKP